MNDTTTTITKIRALLNKADATTFEAERELFRQKAFEIMMREGLTEKDIADANSDTFEVAHKSIKLSSTVWRELQQLGSVVADMNGAVVRITTYNPSFGARVHFYGTAAQVEICEMMFVALSAQCASACRRRPKYESPREFTMGFAQGVRKNFRSAVQQVEKDAPGTGLVLVSTAKQIETRLSKGRPSRSQPARAGAAGYAAGQRADAGIRQRVEASSRRAIG